MPTADWQRLAKHVTARRRALGGKTQADIQAAGGPSVATMRLIEGALQHGYRDSILSRLEHALQWQPGSIDAILAGGEPTTTGPPARNDNPTLEDELRGIADNPDRSDHLRSWARDQIVQLAAIRAANAAEAQARGETAG